MFVVQQVDAADYCLDCRYSVKINGQALFQGTRCEMGTILNKGDLLGIKGKQTYPLKTSASNSYILIGMM